MRLHVYEWGDAGAPPVVCVHGISAHGLRFRKLAEERLAPRFRVLSVDLRGHARSGSEPPWTFPTHVRDLRETIAALGVERATWMGHSFGGRLILELAAIAPEAIERAVLLDPAIDLLPHVAYQFAETERLDRAFGSIDEAVAARLESDPLSPRAFVEEDYREHLRLDPDGLYRFRFVRSCVVSVYGELASAPPPPETLSVPTLMVYAPAFGLVREEHLEAYAAALGDLLTVVPVPGGHMVYWDAFNATAAAIDAFLFAGER